MADLEEVPTLVTDGNFNKEELLNSLTHGFGMIASLVAGFKLMQLPAHSTEVQ